MIKNLIAHILQKVIARYTVLASAFVLSFFMATATITVTAPAALACVCGCPCVTGCSCTQMANSRTKELITCRHAGEGSSQGTVSISPYTVSTPGGRAPNSHNSCVSLLDSTSPTSLIPESLRGRGTGGLTPDTLLAHNGLADVMSPTEIALIDSPLAEPPGWSDPDGPFGSTAWEDLSVEQQFQQYASRYEQTHCTDGRGHVRPNCDNPFELDAEEQEFLQNCFNNNTLEECASDPNADTIMKQILGEQSAILNNCERPDELAFSDDVPEAIRQSFEIRAAGFDAAQCKGSPALRPHITAEQARYQIWLLDDFFKERLLPAMMMLTEQLTTAGVQQIVAIGGILDAELQVKAQRLIQKKQAEAQADYQPSTGMCTIGTVARSLGASEQNARYNALMIGQLSLNRQIGVHSSMGAAGISMDRPQRVKEFTERFCDKNDSGFSQFCPANKNTVNADINFSTLLNTPRSLNIDFTDSSITDDERAVVEMSKNLFSHNLIKRWERSEIAGSGKQDELRDFRAILAKRSVAENSFYSIVGMKSSGATEAAETHGYLKAVMAQFGVTDEEELNQFVKNRPSYYSQLEFLSQRLYQTPDFYTNLYTHPSDVLRKEVSMQAIRLMLERNMYKSELRAETNLAVILELELDALQKQIESNFEEIEADRAVER